MRTLALATFCAGLLTMLKYTYRWSMATFFLYRCCDSRNILRIMFAILTFAISIVDISTFWLWHYDCRHFDSAPITRPASLQAWQMFARTVEWHHTSLNICSSFLPETTDNSRPVGWSRCGGWFSQARQQLTKEGSCGLQQQQQHKQTHYPCVCHLAV